MMGRMMIELETYATQLQRELPTTNQINEAVILPSIGAGAFRTVYAIEGSPWVVKVAHDDFPNEANHWEHAAWAAFVADPEQRKEWPIGVRPSISMLLDDGRLLAERLTPGRGLHSISQPCDCANLAVRWQGCWIPAVEEMSFEQDAAIHDGWLVALDMGC